MEKIEELIEKYVIASINYGIAQEEGNAKKVNKNVNIIRKVMAQLKESSLFYADYLEPLLEHENDYVRLEAAFDLLPIVSEKAEETLSELSCKRGLLGIEAEMTLKEWKNGNIMF